MILVTGARGFIGTRLVAHLDRDGRDYRAYEGDTRDGAALRRQAVGCTAIAHLAFKQRDEDGTGFAANVKGGVTVAEVAAERGLRLVSLSSAGVYGHGPQADVDEDTPLDPDTPLSRSRAAVDRELIARAEAGDPVVLLRTRFVYGPGDRHVLPRIHRAASRSPVWVDGGRARLSLVHVDDLARVITAAATRPLSPEGPVFHVTDGVPVRFRDLAEALCARLGGQPPRLSVPLGLLYPMVALSERLRGVDPEQVSGALSSIRLKLAATDQALSSARLQRWMPELPFRTLAEGLDDSVAWYRSLG